MPKRKFSQITPTPKPVIIIPKKSEKRKYELITKPHPILKESLMYV